MKLPRFVFREPANDNDGDAQTRLEDELRQIRELREEVERSMGRGCLELVRGR